MTRSKHTPAPWRADPSAGFGYRYLVITFPAAIPEPELVANAQLASASPEMFSALSDLLEWGEIEPSPIPPKLLEAARSALCKAMGTDVGGPTR